MMLFGEKYPDPVRLVTMGEFSRELCGGTHVSNTAEVEDFEIISEESVSTGTRRVVALTGERASEQAHQTRATLDQAAQLLGVTVLEVPAALRSQVAGPARPAQATVVRRRAVRCQRRRSRQECPPAVAATYEQLRGALREAARILNVAAMDVPERTAALLAEVAQLHARVAELSRGGLLSADALIERGEVRRRRAGRGV